MTFELDGIGRLMPQARLAVQRSVDFYAGAMPSPVYLGTGTEVASDAGASVSYLTTTTNVPGATITCATGGGKSASLYMPGFSLADAGLVAARFTWIVTGGRSFNFHNVSGGFYGTASGARAIHNHNENTVKLGVKVAAGTEATTVLNDRWEQSWGRQRFSVTVTPADKKMYFSKTHPDTVDWQIAAGSTLDLGIVYPFVRVSTPGSNTAAESLIVNHMAVDLFYI